MKSNRKALSTGSNKVVGLVFALMLALLLPGSALATEIRSEIATFGPDGTPTTQFGFPGAIGVDEGTHSVYVADYTSDKVEKFNESGTPTNFSALGSNEIGGFSFLPGEALQQIAVNQSSHAIYVADFGTGANGVIKAFQQNGEPLQFTAGPGAGTNELPGFHEVCGVAVDANGAIYMGDYGAGVHVFAPSGAELTSFSSEESCNVAVDSAGNVYVGRWALSHKSPKVTKLVPSAFPVTPSTTYSSAAEVGGSDAAFALAVDPSTGYLYDDLGGEINVFDAPESPLRYSFGTFTNSEGVAVDGVSGKVYVSDSGGSRRVIIFGPPESAPTVTTENASPVATTTATLNGTVNPNGGALTECFFEYGTTTSYGETAACNPSAGSIPPDSSGHAVTAAISGLLPSTTYHFRLVSASAIGTSRGQDRTFITLAPPAVSAQSVEAVSASDAVLNARINPGGAPTTYRVEYGTTLAYGQSTAESNPIGFAGDYSQHTVSVHLSGLAPSTIYHFRFVAASTAGSGVGTDVTFSTYGAPASFARCDNDVLRSGSGAYLPDCRAYEQVSPAQKFGTAILWGRSVALTSPRGDRTTFATNSGLSMTGGSSSAKGITFLAARSAAGWNSDGTLPLAEPGAATGLTGWGEDLSTSVSTVEKGLAAGIYLRDSATGVQQQLVSEERLEPNLAGVAAEDGADMIFESSKALAGTEAVAGKPNLYELDHGALALAGRVPVFPATTCVDGSGPACVAAPNGAFGAAYEWLTGARSTPALPIRNAISADGSKVFFTESGTGRVYLREAGVATRQISASQRELSDPNGEKAAALIEATRSGSVALFLSCEKLTDDSTAVSTIAEETCSDTAKQGQDLYAYDTASGQLSDLTVDPNPDPFGAQVLGVVGASADGSDVYFVANGVLAAGASAGSCKVGGPGGQCSLYLAHRNSGGPATITFVARLSSSGESTDDRFDWLPGNLSSNARVSAGGVVLFSSRQQLTSYDNHGVAELYRFAPGDSAPACVSCNPTGVVPVDAATLQSGTYTFNHPAENSLFRSRNISADGSRIFFESPDKLVSADVNGDLSCPDTRATGRPLPACTDVYEWEAGGAGTCTQASSAFSVQNGGCLYLLSSGTSGGPSTFGDADAEGDNVFFFTEQPLVPQDGDRLYDAYDARVGGGLAAQHQGPEAGCTGDGCRGPSSGLPAQPSAGSAALAGPGNQKAKRQHKKHAKKKKQHKAKQHKKQKGKSAAKRAGRNRGGAK